MSEQKKSIESKVRQFNVPGGTIWAEYKLSQILANDEKVEAIVEAYTWQYCLLVATHRRLICLERLKGEGFTSGDIPYSLIELIEYESRWLEKQGKILINKDIVFKVDKKQGEDFVDVVRRFVINLRSTLKAHGILTEKELFEQESGDRSVLISQKEQQLDRIRQEIRDREEENINQFPSPHWIDPELNDLRLQERTLQREIDELRLLR